MPLLRHALLSGSLDQELSSRQPSCGPNNLLINRATINVLDASYVANIRSETM